MFSETLDAIRTAKHWLWSYPFHHRSDRVIRDHLRDHKDDVRVNIGSGANALAGWLNGDVWPAPGVVFIDALGRLPFDAEVVQCINAEHFIEHLCIEDGARFPAEAHRVLAGNGVLRLTTPDLERLMAMYMGLAEPTGDALLAHHRKVHGRPAEDLCSWFNDHMHRWGHQHLYDPQALERALARAGFENVQRCRFGESSDLRLVGVERHDEGVTWMRSAYLLIVEARKQ